MVNVDFTGKHYIVTGASSGMGREVAIELAKSGWGYGSCNGSQVR